MTEQIVISPQPGPQTEFLQCPADIAIVGGAAGGGKTWSLLLEPLRHIENARFGATIFRQTYKQIREEGGLWDESVNLYPMVDGSPNVGRCQWTFPSGAKIRFSYLYHESDVYAYQGAQIPLIGFDQLEHFSASQFFYMLSRNRSTCGVIPYVRATCNPDASSWLADFLSWWIDQETGYAIPERSGVIRYFYRGADNQIIWSGTKREIIEAFPETFDILVEKTGKPPETFIKSFTFIPASIYDNRRLLEVDPGYLGHLLTLPLVERERLLHGNWKIKHESGKFFNRGWFAIVPTSPAGGRVCRYWDFAATEKKLKKKDPDYTAAVKEKVLDGKFYIQDCVAVQEGPAAVDRLFINTTIQDVEQARREGASYMVRWEEEPGSAGKRESWRLVSMLQGIVADCKGVPSSGSKLERAKGLASQAEVGNVVLVSGEWNERWLTHMHNQPDHPHDDIMDGSSGAYNSLVSQNWTTSWDGKTSKPQQPSQGVVKSPLRRRVRRG